MLLFLLACTSGREPLAFEVALGGAVCDDVDELVLPVGHLWLQQPAELAWSWPGLVSSAWAHPGHDPAELLGPWELSPCDGPVELGEGQGYDSELATGQLVLLGEARLLAELDGLPVELSAELDHPVSGIPLVADLVDGAHVTLAFDPTLTLSVLPVDDSDGDGRLTTDDEGLLEAFTYGLANPNSWTLSLETP